jgi:hypothetical protein
MQASLPDGTLARRLTERSPEGSVDAPVAGVGGVTVGAPRDIGSRQGMDDHRRTPIADPGAVAAELDDDGGDHGAGTARGMRRGAAGG